MYELINTSVPNGLIAGTHGFATVAMTKGMPDAIRQRVENFCAYPHRTSAHDASYFSENPVNWFHLMLPGGDHVVGRTAPAEFDYTGRTNRISRTLHFASREMPISGGAYVLTAESSRFCENWHGEPRYLPSDKTTAGRLQLDNRPSGYEPTYWIQMFGADGKAYAQKFAALLEQNMRTSKGIYFKASKVDNDGKRLLGLFADLINILPDELAAQVTFSTFAACVPNGVACHLRGIYDKDRAFETASALQPWVDCENCCVKHPELLPEALTVKTIRADAQNPRMTATAERKPHTDVRANNKNWTAHGSRPYRSVTPSSKKLPIGSVAIVVLAVFAIGGIGWLFLKDAFRASVTSNIVIGDEKANSGIKKYFAEYESYFTTFQQETRLPELKCLQTKVSNKISALRELVKIIDEKNDIAQLLRQYEELLPKIGDKMDTCEQKTAQARRQEKVDDRKLKELEHNRYRTSLADCRSDFDSATTLEQLRAIKNKVDILKGAVEKAQAKNESLKGMVMDCSELGGRISDKIREVENAARTRLELDSIVRTPLKCLTKIDKVLKNGDSWEDKIETKLKMALTNKWSIAEWRYEQGRVVCRLAYFKNEGRKLRLVREDGVEREYSPWTIAHCVVSKDKKVVFWCRNILHGVNFTKSDMIDLKNMCFGCDEAYALWSRFRVPVYEVSWATVGVDGEHDNENAPGYFCTMDRIEFEHYVKKISERNNNSAADKKKKADFEKKVNGLERQIRDLQKEIDGCSDKLNKLKKFLADYAAYKKEKADADKRDEKEKKKEINHKIKTIRKDALAAFSKYQKFKDRCRNGEVNLDAISEQDCDDAVNQEKTDMEEKKKGKESELDGVKNLAERSKKAKHAEYRKREFEIKLLKEDEVPSKIAETQKNGKIDRALIFAGDSVGYILGE